MERVGEELDQPRADLRRRRHGAGGAARGLGAQQRRELGVHRLAGRRAAAHGHLPAAEQQREQRQRQQRRAPGRDVARGHVRNGGWRSC